MHKTLSNYWRFLLAGIINQSQTGAVIPSQRFLIDRMIEPIPTHYRGQILELGAGTGALTQRLAVKCPRAHILACEINSVLAKSIRNSMAGAGLTDRVDVLSDAAEHVLARIAKAEIKPPEFILSGIPLGNLGRYPAVKLIEAIHRGLAPRGLYIQFQHSLIDRKKIKERFSRLRTIPVLLNLPPAFVYYALK